METSMTDKHTPGPWRVAKLGGGIVEASYDGEWLPVANVGAVNISDHDLLMRYRQESPANARLIAAAPELLEALRKIHRRAEDCHLGREVVESDSFHFHEIMVEADAAIKAAKGDA